MVEADEEDDSTVEKQPPVDLKLLDNADERTNPNQPQIVTSADIHGEASNVNDAQALREQLHDLAEELQRRRRDAEVDEEAGIPGETVRVAARILLLSKLARSVGSLLDRLNAACDAGVFGFHQMMYVRESRPNFASSLCPDAGAVLPAELWGKLRGVTAGLSQRLCEQLRLVLEPMVATKLQGDYRSGKRINMRRVIPYIASGFRKDKIWLRRTKPAKRDYQVKTRCCARLVGTILSVLFILDKTCSTVAVEYCVKYSLMPITVFRYISIAATLLRGEYMVVVIFFVCRRKSCWLLSNR